MNAPIRPPSLENASPQQIYRAILATDFRAFVEYVFGLLRPGIPFKPNWHIDDGPQGFSGGDRRGEAADHHCAAPPSEVDYRVRRIAGLVSSPQPVGARRLRFLLGRTGKNPRQRLPPRGHRSGLSGSLSEDGSGTGDR